MAEIPASDESGIRAWRDLEIARIHETAANSIAAIEREIAANEHEITLLRWTRRIRRNIRRRRTRPSPGMPPM